MSRYKRGVTLKTTKGYPRITAGPLRNQYLHRVVAEAMLGRKLNKDEEVHHRDGDRLNFHHSNLMILGEYDHGWVSSRQAWFMRQKDKQEKRDWDEEIIAAKATGNAWAYADGHIEERWEIRKAAF